MTLYPPINPDGKPACWPQQHMEQIAGHCDACGQHARLYPIAEGPICGPAAICADCIWELTPRDLHFGQPLFAAARREIEGRCQSKPVAPTHVSTPVKFLAPTSEVSQRPEQVCEGQMAFDFTACPQKQSPPAEKAPAPDATGSQQPKAPIANTHNVQRPPTAVSDIAKSSVVNANDGIHCDECGQLIRIYLDNAVVGRSGERCCLDCFEARHNLEPFIVTAAWLDEHGDELEQDWRFVYDVAELILPNGVP
ncbi:MAG: hypothetical protein GY803_04910 [Chloroflexi bacterium]|nr:hypothetical protein [Chloroflexota bacterium]